ncbi:hypothetical protein [Lacticaseibacillus paracasei]|uniref:hypothetical protein n=1 Tax=Lacticaseibacillus paracasei TaxID=1597 RepID=UPI0015FAA545|nr:hypothetical protein [Lacticaseibacillus paracasei]MBB1167263.1 hypothetical protein [Lacticaseibacillus paracasei]
MTVETKRDVFDEVRYKFRNFKNEHRHGMYASPDSIDHYLSDSLKRYAAALPDDLPVIPEAAGEILRSAHGQDNLLGVLETAKYGYKVSETLAWIIANQNTFARAWVLGVWSVEETGEIVKLEAEK